MVWPCRHHRQHDLIKSGIGHDDVGDQMGQVGDGVDDAEPEVDAAPRSPARGWGGRRIGVSNQNNRDQGQQEVAEHGPKQKGQGAGWHVAFDLWRLAME
jgi:hypothetical protein